MGRSEQGDSLGDGACGGVEGAGRLDMESGRAEGKTRIGGVNEWNGLRRDARESGRGGCAIILLAIMPCGMGIFVSGVANVGGGS